MSDLIVLPSLIFPPIAPRVQTEDGTVRIFDIIRKQYVVLTPEEWVRQHVINWLISERRYPAGRGSIERTIDKQGMRYDILWVDSGMKPFLLVECKAPSVRVTADTLRQSAWYNITLKAPYVLLTNGFTAYCARVDADGVVDMCPDIPAYPERS